VAQGSKANHALTINLDQSDEAAQGSEMAFLVLLFGVSATGLALYGATGSALVSVLLPLHLGLVFVFFILTPYSKMAHGFYRMAALIRDVGINRARGQ